MLTDERLAAIRERESKATEGPWCFERWEFGGEIICEYGSLGIEVGKPGLRERDVRSPYDEDLRIADFEFLASARTDIPDLLREVERLRAESALSYASGYGLGYGLGYEQGKADALAATVRISYGNTAETPDAE